MNNRVFGAIWRAGLGKPAGAAGVLRRRIIKSFIARFAIVAAVAADAAGLCAARAGASPAAIPHNVAVTRITAPVDADGMINYGAALAQILSRGVTPRNNAAIPILAVCRRNLGIGVWTNIHNHYAFKPDVRQMHKLLRQLGLHGGKFTGPRYELLTDYLKKHAALFPAYKPASGNTAEIDRALNYMIQVQSAALTEPWSARRFPWLAAQLRRNNAALNLIVRGSQLPKFYVPQINLHPHSSLIGNRMPYLAATLRLAKALAERAMLELHEGKRAECEQDLLAMHRLGRLITRSGFLIGTLVGYEIESLAVHTDAAMANAGWISRKNYLGYARRLRHIPPFAPFARNFDIGERFLVLDYFQHMADRKDRRMLRRIGFSSLIPHGWNTGDTIFAMRWSNRIIDREVAALKQPNFIRRWIALQHFNRWRAVQLAGARQNNPVGATAADKLLTPAARTARIRTAVAAKMNLDQASLALAAYRARHGAYPNSLAALVPHYLPSIPHDPFTGKPLAYLLQVRDCRVWSIGGFTAGGKNPPRWARLQVVLTFPPGRYDRLKLPVP